MSNNNLTLSPIYERHDVSRMVGVCGAWCGLRLHRKPFAVCLMVLLCLVTAVCIFNTAKSDLYREKMMEQRVGNLYIRLEFLESMQRMRQEDFIDLQNKALSARGNGTPHHFNFGAFTTTTGPDVLSLLKNMTGSRAATGMYPKHQLQRTSFVFQLMPHLMNDPNTLRPAYHMRSDRPSVDVVIGIPTVKRDKESYLFKTIQSIIDGMTEPESRATLIIVYIGETDLEFVLNTARQLENTFPKHVENGLIEVLSPSASFYPDFEGLIPTLGDSLKRAKWRTKQNLDSMYLMAYAQSRGSFYLMLEDDVLATKSFMKDIKQFTAQVTVSTPDWFFIEFCAVGGIGKLFKSANLLHFITYMQLFYTNMPIDWLLESYLGDRICSIHKTSKQCETSKTEIRPKYKKSLFKHIGLYSSLKGKIQKVNDLSLSNRALYFPHKNPPVAKLFTNLEMMSDNHSLKSAYEGRDFFWATKPKRGSVVEFWFEKPLLLDGYTFRSANLEHKNDKFYNTVVEVLPSSGGNFTEVGEFDEFGLADDKINKDLGPLTAIRLKMLKDSQYWALLSEIEIRPTSEDSR